MKGPASFRLHGNPRIEMELRLSYIQALATGEPD